MNIIVLKAPIEKLLQFSTQIIWKGKFQQMSEKIQEQRLKLIHSTSDQKHDLDLFSLNTNLSSLNQEQAKLNSVRSQSDFWPRFTLSNDVSSAYICVWVSRLRECSALICALSSILFLLFKYQGKGIMIWTPMFPTYSTDHACRRWEKHFAFFQCYLV